ncbi:MAG: hypothetical protein HWD86_06585 [Kangiellaceae bacterium]|nr:hypothetical protein [Kangiellaceae bacterium]
MKKQSVSALLALSLFSLIASAEENTDNQTNSDTSDDEANIIFPPHQQTHFEELIEHLCNIATGSSQACAQFEKVNGQRGHCSISKNCGNGNANNHRNSDEDDG